MKKIIFVCTGNTCRSPMAEHILKKRLKERGAEKDFEVTSAGVGVSGKNFISQHSLVALKNMGIKAPKRQVAKQLKASMLVNDAIIITATAAHKQILKNLNNVYSFGEFDSGMDLPDPYGAEQKAYDQIAKIIDFAMNEIVEKLLNSKL